MHTHADHGPNTGHPHDHNQACAPAATACCAASSACCGPASPVAPPPDSAGLLLLRIPAMDCPTEEAQIRRALEGGPPVDRLVFDLANRTLGVQAAPPAWPQITAAIQAAGFTTQILSTPPTAQQGARRRRQELWRLVAALLVAGAAELIDVLAAAEPVWRALGMAVAAAAIALSGLTVFRKGLQSLARGQLNINALMSVAVAGAFLIGQWPEAAMVMALYALAELIEARSVERARDAISGLLALSPPQTEVRQADGQWAVVDAQQVPTGAVVRVKPGERLALDGRVTAGRSAVDQSAVTGESLPVDKAPGDMVYAGTINQGGGLEFEVTQAAGDTLLARIIHAVEQAQGQRAPTQRFVDRFADIYTPAVFALALGVALAAPLLLGWTWQASIYKALVLLVIACPCALVISTPVTVVSGLAAAARQGILIKGGVYLEQARRLTVLALDKTGTLTEGAPRLVAHEGLSDALPLPQVLQWARSLALRSDHPVAQAIATGLPGESLPVDDLQAEIGRGVQGAVAGQPLRLGNHRWMHELGLCSPELEARMRAHETQGRTVSILAGPTQVLALLAVADAPKPHSREAVEALHALGVRTVMLTGDNEATARHIAAQVGIRDVRAQLLPQDKQRIVTTLGGDGEVGMVGDGINDSPSLAAAAIGFSMGAAGTDTAKEAADVLIMNDDLRQLPRVIRLSRRTHAVLWQNISLALGIKAVFFGLAMLGSASMWMAVFADMGASLLVVFNGLRLLQPADAPSRPA